MEKNKINISETIGSRLDPQFYNYRFKSLIDRIKIGNSVILSKITKFSSETWNQKDFFDEIFPYIEISAIDTISGDLVEISQVEKVKAPSRAKKIVRNNDIIVSTTRPNRGAISLLRIDYNDIIIASTGFAVIRAVSNSVLREYLFIILRQNCCLDQMLQRSSGGNYPAISEEELKKIQIPLPSIEIQKEIVNLYTKAQQQKQDKDKEAKSLLESIDSYLFEKLGIPHPKKITKVLHFTVNISNILGGRIDPHQFNAERMNMIKNIYATNKWRKLKEVVHDVKSITKSFSNGDVYIGLENIESNTGEYSQTSEKESISSAAVFKTGHILFPKLRPYLNKVYRAEFDGMCSTEFHVYEARNIDADYLSSVLRSKMILAQTEHLMTGNTLPRLQTKDVENIIIPYPSIEEQREIVKYINKTRIKAQSLKKEGVALLDKAKSQIETMILG